MKFRGKWKCSTEQEAELLKKTLELDWGFTVKVNGKVITVEGEHPNPQNLKDYLFNKLIEIEFVVLGGVKLKLAELKQANPDEEGTIWFVDKEGNIIKKSRLSLSATKMREELIAKGFFTSESKQIEHISPEGILFDTGDEIELTKELHLPPGTSSGVIPEGLKGKIRTKNMAGYQKFWTYVITFPGFGDVEIEGEMAHQLLKKASVEADLGDTLKQWEQNKGELMKLQMMMKQLQGKQQELLAEVKNELSGSSEEVKEIDGYVIRYKSWEQRKPPSYKMAFEKVLTKVNGQIKSMMVKMVEDMTTMSTREKLEIVRVQSLVSTAGLQDWVKKWWGKFIGQIKQGWKALTNVLSRGSGELRRLTEQAEKAPDVMTFYDGMEKGYPSELRDRQYHFITKIVPRLINLGRKNLMEKYKVTPLHSHIIEEDGKYIILYTTDKGYFRVTMEEEPKIIKLGEVSIEDPENLNLREKVDLIKEFRDRSMFTLDAGEVEKKLKEFIDERYSPIASSNNYRSTLEELKILYLREVGDE